MMNEQMQMLDAEIQRLTEEREVLMELAKEMKSQIYKLESAKKTLEEIYA